MALTKLNRLSIRDTGRQVAVYSTLSNKCLGSFQRVQVNALSGAHRELWELGPPGESFYDWSPS